MLSKLIAWFNPWDCETLNNLWFNSSGHINQLAYRADDRLVFLWAGRSEQMAVDVSDPSSPLVLGLLKRP